jgi:hypothetical protein
VPDLRRRCTVVGGPSFITKKKIKDLIAEADRAVKPT